MQPSRPLAAEDRAASETPLRSRPLDGPVEAIAVQNWSGAVSPAERDRALQALEGGKILLLADLAFQLEGEESRFLEPSSSDGKHKNISFDPRSGALGGTGVLGQERDALSRLLARFASEARTLLCGLIPRYAAQLEFGRTSLRPASIDQRQMSFRKDDRRLHVDAFPSHPVQGRRILRVFSNINPDGAARVWHVGEPFTDYARRFLPQPSFAIPGTAALLASLGVTKGRRTAYDRMMLQLHDRAKADTAYQRDASRAEIHFSAGSSWIVYTDLVPHAAIIGQHALEQTFYLPVAAMGDPDKAPLRVLENLTGRRLVT